MYRILERGKKWQSRWDWIERKNRRR